MPPSVPMVQGFRSRADRRRSPSAARPCLGLAAREVQLLPGRQEGLQRRARVALDQHLARARRDALDRGGTAGYSIRCWRPGSSGAGLCRQGRQRLRRFLPGLARAPVPGTSRAASGASSRSCSWLAAKDGSRAGQRREQRMLRVPGLDPEPTMCPVPRRSARRRARRGRLPASAARTGARARGSRCEQSAVGVDRRDQRDAAEVVALGDHLRADQHVDLASVHRPSCCSSGPSAACCRRPMRRDCAPSARGHRPAGRRSAPPAARCRVRSARCRGCRSPGRRAARARWPQWWQRSVRSSLVEHAKALQCGQSLFQPQAAQCSTGA